VPTAACCGTYFALLLSFSISQFDLTVCWHEHTAVHARQLAQSPLVLRCRRADEKKNGSNRRKHGAHSSAVVDDDPRQPDTYPASQFVDAIDITLNIQY
jgi:hypothetical protein